MTAKLTQQNISRLLDRHGIPVREEYPNGYRLPLVQTQSVQPSHSGLHVPQA